MAQTGTGTSMILAVGRDKDLLCTRVEVLRRADANVLGALLEDVEGALREQVFDLVVLCHTLSEDETALIVGMALETQRKIRVMRLEALEEPRAVNGAIRVGGQLIPEPEMLVTEVRALLCSQRFVA